MDRAQKYISILLERLPKWELRSYDNQTNLDRLRNRISSSPNVHDELKNLYRVKGFSDFAVSLMWIAEKVAKDSTKEESTLDEETLVFSLFRQAVGESTELTQTPVTQATEAQTQNLPDFGAFQISSSESMFDISSSQPQPIAQMGFSGETRGLDQEKKFAQLLEKFLESVQSGNEDRLTLISDVLNECNAVVYSTSAAKDYKEFCRLLIEFLKYISDNQFLDDIRVMNIVSNIHDPFSQWARLDTNSRVGIIDQAIEILRDFKTMFE